tara:strand:- start:4581 stop:4868 length:288 start_codon:yes stop_codon:yes gene_type:complete
MCFFLTYGVAIRYKVNYIIDVLNKQEMGMTKMISQEQAESLAVIYSAWCRAEYDDVLAKSTLGKMLLEAQDETGVYLVNVDLLQIIINRIDREVA